MNWPFTITAICFCASHWLLSDRLRMAERALDSIRDHHDGLFTAWMRGIIREEIDDHEALRSARDPKTLEVMRACVAKDRPVIDAMREGRFPTTSDWDGSDE